MSTLTINPTEALLIINQGGWDEENVELLEKLVNSVQTGEPVVFGNDE